MDIQPINKSALPEIVSEQIVSQIVSGKVKPGEKLPSELSLSSRFQVSRSVIREAIAGLISKGIVERRNNGIFVKTTSISDMYESVSLLITTNNIPLISVIEARQVIEIENASLAAERATKDDLNTMLHCIKKMESPDASDEDVVKYASDFHRAIASSTHNSILEAFYQVIQEYLYHDERSLNTIRESARQHYEIYLLIKEGKSEEVREEMRKHLTTVKDSFFPSVK